MIITQIILIVLLASILAYDVVAVLIGGTKWTISFNIYAASKQYPIIPFVAGVVAGHLFWSIN